jgi:phage-related minor tail protein
MKRCFAAVAIFIGTFVLLTLGMTYEVHRHMSSAQAISPVLARDAFIVSVLFTILLAFFAAWLSGRLVGKSAA